MASVKLIVRVEYLEPFILGLHWNTIRAPPVLADVSRDGVSGCTAKDPMERPGNARLDARLDVRLVKILRR